MEIDCRSKIANALDPHQMTALERRAELTKLLAMGVIRLHTRENRSVVSKKIDQPVDFSAGESVCGLNSIGAGQ